MEKTLVCGWGGLESHSSMGFASFINRHDIRELVLCVWVRVKNADFSMGFASFINTNGNERKKLVLCV